MARPTIQHIAQRLRRILDQMDLDSDGLINRKVVRGSVNEVDMLLDNLELVVKYLQFDSSSTKKEIHEFMNKKHETK